MKNFIIGAIAGFLVAVLAFIVFKPAIQYDVGKLLDEDIVYLKGGAVIRGWIEQEDANSVLIRTEKDSFSVPRDKCSAIRKNARLYYIRKLI